MQPTYSHLEVLNQHTLFSTSLTKTSFTSLQRDEKEAFLKPSEHPSDLFLKELSEILFNQSPFIDQNGYVTDEQLKFQTLALDERFAQVTARIQELLQTQITTQQGSLSLAHIFQTIYYEQIASTAPQNSSFYFVGSFLRPLMRLCVKTVLQQWNLKENTQKASRVAYNDIDVLIQLTGPLSEQASILHTNLKQQFKQSAAKHHLRTPIDKSFPPQYFDICYAEEGNPDRSFDICLLTSSSRIGLSFLHSMALKWDLKSQTFQWENFKHHLLQAFIDFEADNLNLLDAQDANFIAWWKVLHEMTKGMRVKSSVEAFYVLREHSLSYSSPDKMLEQVSKTFQKFYEQHGKKDPHYLYALFTAFYFSCNLSQDLLKAIKEKVDAQTDAVQDFGLHRVLQRWKVEHSLIHFYQLVQFAGILRLCIPTDQNTLPSVKIIEHLKTKHLQIGTQYFCLLPLALDEVMTALLSFSPQQWQAYAEPFENILADIFPFKALVDLFTFHAPLPKDLQQKGLTLGLRLIEHAHPSIQRIGLQTLLTFYANYRLPIDSDFIEALPTLLCLLKEGERRTALKVVIHLLSQLDSQRTLLLQEFETELCTFTELQQLTLLFALLLEPCETFKPSALRLFKTINFASTLSTISQKLYMKAPEWIWKETLKHYLQRRLTLKEMLSLYQVLCTHVDFQAQHAPRTRMALGREIALSLSLTSKERKYSNAFLDILEGLLISHSDEALAFWQRAQKVHALDTSSPNFLRLESLLQTHFIQVFQKLSANQQYQTLQELFYQTKMAGLWQTLHYPSLYFEQLNLLLEYTSQHHSSLLTKTFDALLDTSCLHSKQESTVLLDEQNLTFQLAAFYQQLSHATKLRTIPTETFVGLAPLLATYQTQLKSQTSLLNTLLIEKLFEILLTKPSVKDTKPALIEEVHKAFLSIFKQLSQKPSDITLKLALKLPPQQLLLYIEHWMTLKDLNVLQLLSHFKLLQASNLLKNTVINCVQQLFDRLSIENLPAHTTDLVELYLYYPELKIEKSCLKVLLERSFEICKSDLTKKLFSLLQQNRDLFDAAAFKQLELKFIKNLIVEDRIIEALERLLARQGESEEDLNLVFLLKTKSDLSLEKFYQMLLQANFLIHCQRASSVFLSVILDDLKELINLKQIVCLSLADKLFALDLNQDMLASLSSTLIVMSQHPTLQKPKLWETLRQTLKENLAKVSRCLIANSHTHLWLQLILSFQLVDSVLADKELYRPFLLKSLTHSPLVDLNSHLDVALNVLEQLNPQKNKHVLCHDFFDLSTVKTVVDFLLTTVRHISQSDERLLDLIFDFGLYGSSNSQHVKPSIIETFLTAHKPESALFFFTATLEQRKDPVRTSSLRREEENTLVQILQQAHSATVSARCLQENFLRLTKFLPNLDPMIVNPVLHALFKAVYSQSAKDAVFLMHLTKRFDLELLQQAFNIPSPSVQLKNTLLTLFNHACNEKLFQTKPNTYLELVPFALEWFQPTKDHSGWEFINALLYRLTQFVPSSKELQPPIFNFFNTILTFIKERASFLASIPADDVFSTTVLVNFDNYVKHWLQDEEQWDTLLSKKDILLVKLCLKRSSVPIFHFCFEAFSNLFHAKKSVYEIDEAPLTLIHLITSGITLLQQREVNLEEALCFLLERLNEQPCQYYYLLLNTLNKDFSLPIEIKKAIFHGLLEFVSHFALNDFSNADQEIVRNALDYFLKQHGPSFYAFCLSQSKPHDALLDWIKFFPSQKQELLVAQFERFVVKNSIKYDSLKSFDEAAKQLEDFIRERPKSTDIFKREFIEHATEYLLNYLDFEVEPGKFLTTVMSLIQKFVFFTQASAHEIAAPCLQYLENIKTHYQPSVLQSLDAPFKIRMSGGKNLDYEGLPPVSCSVSLVFNPSNVSELTLNLFIAFLNGLLISRPKDNQPQLLKLACVHYYFKLLFTYANPYDAGLLEFYLRFVFTHLATSNYTLYSYHTQMLPEFTKTRPFREHLKIHKTKFAQIMPNDHSRLGYENFLLTLYRTIHEGYPENKVGSIHETEALRIFDFIENAISIRNSPHDFNDLELILILRQFFKRPHQTALPFSENVAILCFKRALKRIDHDPLHFVEYVLSSHKTQTHCYLSLAADTTFFFLNYKMWSICDVYLERVKTYFFKSASWKDREIILKVFAQYLVDLVPRMLPEITLYQSYLKKFYELIQAYLSLCPEPKDLIESLNLNAVFEGIDRLQNRHAKHLAKDSIPFKQTVEKAIEQELNRRK